MINDTKQRRPPYASAFKWLMTGARPARGWIILCILTGYACGLLLVVQAWFFAAIVHDVFIGTLSRTDVRFDFLMLCVTVVFRAGLAWAKEITGFRAGATVRQHIRMSLMEHLGSMGPTHPGRAHSGALSATVVEQVEALQPFYAHYLPQLVLAAAIPATILIFVFPISWAAAGLLLLTAPLIPFFMILVGMGAESVSQRHFKALARMSAHFLDILKGLTTLKLLDHSKNQQKTIAKTADAYRIRTMAVLRVAFLSTAVLELFSALSIALVAVYMGSVYLGFARFGLYGETLTLAKGLFILLLAPDFFLPLRELGTHYHAKAEAVGAAEEILKILSHPGVETVVGRRSAAHTNEPSLTSLDLCDVHFGYSLRQPPVLRGVNLRLLPGEQTVLVGESGAGKTTLLNLLLGFNRPDKGALLVNGLPLSNMAPETWRRHIAWVGQQPMLFHATIAANIALARPQASRKEIEDAARDARVMEFARHLPNGLDTLVGEHGWGLSRGQAQRVALARVFLKNAPVVLLDEPAAGLDMTNERLILKSIESLIPGRTVLLLTHRLEFMKTAQRIAVLDQGRIVQQGGYEDLVRSPGAFKLFARLTVKDAP